MFKFACGASLTLGLWALLVPNPAAAVVQAKCVVSKNKCVSKKADSLLKCHQKAETPGKTPDANADGCLDKASAKFDGSPDLSKGCFEKLESKSGNDCITFDDTGSAETAVDACVAAIVSAIDPGGVTQSKCGVSKKKCVATKLKSILKCYQKAQTPGKPTDPNDKGCLDKAKAKFDGGLKSENGCFVKLESKAGNDCQAPTGNQPDLEAIVDGELCVGALLALLETPTPSTTTSSSTTSTTPSTLPGTSTSSMPTPTTTSSTTTSAPTPTTTTSSSTTTTTMGGGTVTCGPMNLLDVTVTLAYPAVVGGLSGVTTNVNYPPPLVMPDTNGSVAVSRVLNLLGGGTTFNFQRFDRDTNGNGVGDRLEVTITTGTNVIPAQTLYRAHFDCANGSVVNPSSLSCFTTNPIDPSGLPLDPSQAAQVTCSLSLSVP